MAKGKEPGWFSWQMILGGIIVALVAAVALGVIDIPGLK